MFDNSKLFSFPFMLVVAAFIGGCSGNVETALDWRIEGGGNSVMRGPEDPPIWSIVTPNSLDPSALVPTDLGRYPLSIEQMSAATAALLTGPQGVRLRKLLKYAVECALDLDERFEFSWTDEGGITHEEIYRGAVGFAPNWPTLALNVTEQEWVSGCVAARTNRQAKAVPISMRGGASELDVDAQEREFFSKREGAFWGNLFSATPYMRACYDAQNVDHSLSMDRECATGYEDEGGAMSQCGMIRVVGSCQQTCQAAVGDGYYSSCQVQREELPPNAQTHRVITVFLH
jgi:hypothetical protein